MNDKSHIRQKAQSARSALRPDARFIAEQSITDTCCELLNKHKAKTPALYIAIKNEVNCRQLFEVLKGANRAPCLPVVVTSSDRLIFREYDPDHLYKGYAGILEPDESCPKILPDAVCVPLLGFDENCMRLGYGQGHFDRTIAHYRDIGHDVLTIGLAFECQKFEHLPCEAHDEALDYVVTEKQIYAA